MKRLFSFTNLVARAQVTRIRALRKVVRSLGCGCVVVGALSYSFTADAYRTLADVEGGTDVTWTQPIVPFVLRGEPVGTLSASAVQSAVLEGMRMWNGVECSAAAFSYLGFTLAEAARDDGTNTIQWVVTGWDRFGDPNEAAVTDLAYSVSEDGGTVLEFDIYLNAQHFSWVSGSPARGAKSIQTVIAHEAGHALGILHPCEVGVADVPACGEEHRHALMHPEYAELVGELGEDDKAAVCSLYPRPDTPSGDDDAVANPAPDCAGGTCSSGHAPHGDPCEAPTDCHSGICRGGYCVERCDASSACTQGSCERGGCVGMSPFGAECELPSECLGRVCLQGDQGTSVCSRPCSAALECPFGWECAEVDGQDVCTPEQEMWVGGCGCRLGERPVAPLSTPLWVGLAVWIARRRCRAVSTSV